MLIEWNLRSPLDQDILQKMQPICAFSVNRFLFPVLFPYVCAMMNILRRSTGNTGI